MGMLCTVNYLFFYNPHLMRSLHITQPLGHLSAHLRRDISAIIASSSHNPKGDRPASSHNQRATDQSAATTTAAGIQHVIITNQTNYKFTL